MTNLKTKKQEDEQMENTNVNEKQNESKRVQESNRDIWNEIKGKPINLFCIKNETIEKYISCDESLLSMKEGSIVCISNVPAALPALEECLKGSFKVSNLDGKILISKK